jgi:hypothetical protein
MVKVVKIATFAKRQTVMGNFMRQPSIFILTIFLLVTNYVAGQTSGTGKTVIITPYTLDKNVCILFQNDYFLILTSTKILVSFYGQYTDSSSWLNHERKLFMECNNNSDTVDFYSCAKLKSLDHLVIKRAANLIDKSTCVVLNKKTNNVVTKLVIKPYDHFDVGGMAYYVYGKLLFETIDRIY